MLGLRNGAVPGLVSSSVMVTKEAFFFSSIHLAILTILTFFLKLVPLWSVVDLHCQVPHPPSASCRSRKRGAFLFCFFLSRKESFPSKPPADFLMSVSLTGLDYLTVRQLGGSWSSKYQLFSL